MNCTLRNSYFFVWIIPQWNWFKNTEQVDKPKMKTSVDVLNYRLHIVEMMISS